MSTVPSRPAEWIIQFLTTSNSAGLCRVVRQDDGSLDLQHLNLKDLKAISKEIKRRLSASPAYSKPSSAARKPEWVASIANVLRLDDVLEVLAPREATQSTEMMRQRASADASSPHVSYTASPRGSSSTARANRSFIQSTTTTAATATSAAPSAAVACATPSKTKTTSKPSAKRSSSKRSMIESDAAMARRLQQQYNQQQHLRESVSTLETASSLPSAAAEASQQNPCNIRNNQHSPNINSYSSKRPRKLTNKTKVKTEPKSPTRGATADDSIQPRNIRESSMVQSLRNMGFTDIREMLSGIRATSTTTDNGAVSAAPHQHHAVENAMLWIVNQREEAAEAKKLDEARISSELANRAVELSRKEERDRQMKIADLNTLFGSVNEGGETTIASSSLSKYFPQSILLKNAQVRKVLHAISTGPGKDVGIQLLQLESKARKWYGTVLPYSHFKHVLCPRFEAWSGEFLVSSSCTQRLDSVSSSVLVQKVSNECTKLERGMYNLSDQEQASFGMAPKLFLEAQRNADARGLPVSEDLSVGDGDVTFIPSVRCRSSCPVAEKAESDAAVEVIEIL